MKLSRLEILSDAEVRQIHDAALDILAECGVEVQSPRLLKLLQAKGATVDLAGARVRFPRALAEDALSHAPAAFDLFNRDGEFAFRLGGGAAKVAAGHNAVFWTDTENGDPRPSTVADVAAFAAICEQLPEIDMVGIPVMPQDVADPKSTLLHGVRAVVENTRKPVYFSTDCPRVNRGCLDLLQAACRGGDLRARPYGISQLSPTSPLYWEANPADAILDCLERGVPVAILPEPNAGVSAPYSLAGLLTVNHAECLSGLIMIQLLQPGAKVMYANSWTTTDMRTGAALVGSIETTQCRVAAAQLARHCRIPSHTTAPNSDNHAHDEQNAWEKTFSLFAAQAAGHDLIVNCGMFATGMTCSHEQLVMDAEIAAMGRRLTGGIEVTAETIAAGLVKETGPRGSFLTADHTLERLASGEFWEPRVGVRGPHGAWLAAGSKNAYKRAQEQARACIARGGATLPAEVQARLAAITAAFSA
jgi:trimethylamine--corrinoid protein Co-methyltransferase